MRQEQDIFVYNEANCFLVSTPAEFGIGMEAGQKLACGGPRAVTIPLAQDDAGVFRVVVGDLTDEEERAWLGKLTGYLDLSKTDRLVFSGGWAMWEEDASFREGYLNEVKVPPGLYRMEVYVCLPDVTAHHILGDDMEGEELARLWMARYPDRVPPIWLVEMAEALYEHFEERLEEDGGDEEEGKQVTMIVRLVPVEEIHGDTGLTGELGDWQARDLPEDFVFWLDSRGVEIPDM